MKDLQIHQTVKSTSKQICPKKLCNFYTKSKRNYDGKLKMFETVSGKDGTLFSHGRYPTKIKPEDLPSCYVEGLYYGYESGFINCSGIKGLCYVPNMYSNHMFKDDFLFISYSKPFVNPDKKLMFEMGGYDEYVWGYNIVNILRAAKKYSGYDISEIKKEIEVKRVWFKENYLEDYEHEVGDKKFFEED